MSEKKENVKVQQTDPKEIEDEVTTGKEEKEEIVEAEKISQLSKGKKILSDAVDNIEGGAKVVGETVNELVGKLKKGASEVIKTGSKVVDELSHTAQVYTEKYKAEIEIRKLKNQRGKQITQLGSAIYKEFKADAEVKKNFFDQKEITGITGQVKELDQKIVEIGQELDKRKEQ